MKKIFYSYLLIGTSIIGILLLNNGLFSLLSNYKSYNTYSIILGIAFLIPLLLMLLKWKKDDIGQSALEEDRINKLIKTGRKIELNLENIPIKTNSYLQEVVVGHGRSERIEKKQIHHNVLIFNAKTGNEKSAFKVDVYMEPEKLKIKLLLQQKTYLYYDEQNPDNYYIDLSFLDDK